MEAVSKRNNGLEIVCDGTYSLQRHASTVPFILISFVFKLKSLKKVMDQNKKAININGQYDPKECLRANYLTVGLRIYLTVTLRDGCKTRVSHGPAVNVLLFCTIK